MKTAALDDAQKSLPDSHYWIKADACDILAGVQESVKGEWSGDVDLNDRSLEAEKEIYTTLKKKMVNLGKEDSHEALTGDAGYILSKLSAYKQRLQKSQE